MTSEWVKRAVLSLRVLTLLPFVKNNNSERNSVPKIVLNVVTHFFCVNMKNRISEGGFGQTLIMILFTLWDKAALITRPFIYTIHPSDTILSSQKTPNYSFRAQSDAKCISWPNIYRLFFLRSIAQIVADMEKIYDNLIIINLYLWFSQSRKWRNCRLTTKNLDYQLGWAILAEFRPLDIHITQFSFYVVKILPTLLVTWHLNT